LVDPLSERAGVAAAFGIAYAPPASAPDECDVVFHASANPKGLATALDITGFEGTVVEVSWFGDAPVSVPLGRAFHSGRLRLVSSQVGQVSPSRRPRWSYARRMAKAMELLKDARLDVLLGDEIPFEQAPQRLPAVFSGDSSSLAPIIRYG
jgi:threonine dehydrogenase-like Zn-dependent dehydrogenase